MTSAGGICVVVTSSTRRHDKSSIFRRTPERAASASGRRTPLAHARGSPRLCGRAGVCSLGAICTHDSPFNRSSVMRSRYALVLLGLVLIVGGATVGQE